MAGSAAFPNMGYPVLEIARLFRRKARTTKMPARWPTQSPKRGSSTNTQDGWFCCTKASFLKPRPTCCVRPSCALS
jgi:hypothetical protein